jgi:tetratricopeptide (TPR) repeat protein
MSKFLAIFAATALTAGSAFAAGTITTGSGEPGNDGKFLAAVSAIKAKQFESAIPMLEEVQTRFPKSADVNNYLGYSNRKIGKRDVALGFYQTALRINPDHRGAHEYLGELYVEMQDLPHAREQLAALERICGTCEESEDLKRHIDGRKS